MIDWHELWICAVATCKLTKISVDNSLQSHVSNIYTPADVKYLRIDLHRPTAILRVNAAIIIRLRETNSTLATIVGNGDNLSPNCRRNLRQIVELNHLSERLSEYFAY